MVFKKRKMNTTQSFHYCEYCTNEYVCNASTNFNRTCSDTTTTFFNNTLVRAYFCNPYCQEQFIKQYEPYQQANFNIQKNVLWINEEHDKNFMIDEDP